MAAVVAAAVALSACGAKNEESKADEGKLGTNVAVTSAFDFEDQKVLESYAVGVSAGKSMAANIGTLDGTGIELDNAVLIQAYADGLKGELKLDEAKVQDAIAGFRTRVNKSMQEKRKLENETRAKEAEENKAKGAAFLEENKTKEGVKVTESGLQYKVLKEGAGKSPKKTDKVKVQYRGTLINGEQFDTTYKDGNPRTFGVNRVISGWTEGLMLMKEGSKYEFYIPSDLAYKEAGRPNIPGNSVLIFEVELLEVVDSSAPQPKKAPAPKPPTDTKAVK